MKKIRNYKRKAKNRKPTIDVLFCLLYIVVLFALIVYLQDGTRQKEIGKVEYETQYFYFEVLDCHNTIDDKKSLGVYTITAYCPCVACSGGYGTQTAIGKKAEANRTVAGWLPFGTEIEINGQRYVVEDRTANWIRERYGGKVIDIYFDTHLEVQKFGKKKLEIFEIVKGR